MNNRDPFFRNAPPNQVVPRALRNRVKARTFVDPRNGQFRGPDDRRQWSGGLGEGRGAKEMRHDRYERQRRQRRQEEGNLIDVLDDDVEWPRAQRAAHRAPAAPREAMPVADARDVDLVDGGLRSASRPAARDQVDLVSPLGNPAEQLMQVDLGPAGLRILPIVPVDQQNSHSAPVSRATASSTPLMNAGAREPANQCASFTASSITTREGVDASSSSASASRRMLRSTTPTRSSRQCSVAPAIRASNSGRPAIAFAARSAPRSYPLGARPYMTATRATTASIVGLSESSHAYNSWSARARALVSGRCTESLERVGGLERRLDRLGALAHACQRLRFGVGRQHAEPHRNPMRQRDVAQTTGCFPGDVLEVWRLPADHAAERDDRIEALTQRRGLSQHRQLERPGRPCDLDVPVRHAALA